MEIESTESATGNPRETQSKSTENSLPVDVNITREPALEQSMGDFLKRDGTRILSSQTASVDMESPLKLTAQEIESKDRESTTFGKLPRKKLLADRDRSNLRKGKWTVEEEEYTSRIIHYFSTGLLTLPEGATLRSYLAEKLNCDPMRITKKYAGAACLGRRAYHFRDRPQPTIAEIHLAKAQLDELEHRFRVRVEEGYSGASSPRTFDMMLALSQQGNQTFMPSQSSAPPAATMQSLLLGMAGVAAPRNCYMFPSQPATSGWNGAPIVQQPAQAQWLLPSVPAPALTISHPNLQPQGIDSALSCLGLNHTAAFLAPVLAQLIASQGVSQAQPHHAHAPIQPLTVQAPIQPQTVHPPVQPITLQVPIQPPNVQSAAQVPAQQQAQAVVPSHAPSTATDFHEDKARLHAMELKKAFERQMNATAAAEIQSQFPTDSSEGDNRHAKTNVTHVVDDGDEHPRTPEDKAAGSILLGFLSSLRQSYLDAIQEKQPPTAAFPTHTTLANEMAKKGIPSVTDASSSHPTSSSEENYDCQKMDPSSSDEDWDGGRERFREQSRGPPRKRLKRKKMLSERRMDE